MNFRLIEYAPLGRHARHCHDTPSITLILGGALEEGTDHGTRRSSAFTVVVKPAGVYHENIYGPAGTRTFRLSLDTRQAAELAPNLAYGWHDGGPVARTMLSAYRDLAQSSGEDRLDAENWVIEILSACNDAPRHRANRRDRWLDDLALSLEAQEGPISIRRIADTAQMHPVSLARAFRRRHRCSISEFVRRRRIVRSCALIERANSLVDIAVQIGFSDQPHFTRAFKTETGVTPAVFRRLAATSGPGSNRSRQHEIPRVY